MDKRHNAIYWVDTDKVSPNPFQPRHSFDEEKLISLSKSIKQYGVLQPLVVTKQEHITEGGNMTTQYELIAGERRLRASKLAGLKEVPVVVNSDEDSKQLKLELAIIENLQREDLNPVDRARAFKELVDSFSLKHTEIAQKIGKSREYISNSIRLLTLPAIILDAIRDGAISEGHARPILMLQDRPEEQNTLFQEIVMRKLTVRDAETIARKIASDKVRKKDPNLSPLMVEVEQNMADHLGTRVHIEPKQVGGKITIDFLSDDDLQNIIAKMMKNQQNKLAEKEKEKEKDGDMERKDDDIYSINNFSL